MAFARGTFEVYRSENVRFVVYSCRSSFYSYVIIRISTLASYVFCSVKCSLHDRGYVEWHGRNAGIHVKTGYFNFFVIEIRSFLDSFPNSLDFWSAKGSKCEFHKRRIIFRSIYAAPSSPNIMPLSLMLLPLSVG